MHPLLKKIDINSCNLADLSANKDLIFSRIIELGLNAKKHGDLIIVKYNKENKYSDNDYIRCSRGIILDTLTKKIVNYSLDGDISFDNFKNKVNWSDVVIENVLDGTMINLYYYKDKWNIATKFSSNAYESKFRSNKTFGNLFEEVVDLNNLKLDNKFSYTLLLQHVDNRIVTNIVENKVYYLESVNLTTGEKVFQDIGLPSVNVLFYNGKGLNVNSYDELVNYLNNELSWENPGLMLYSKDRKWRCKLKNHKYDYIAGLIQNQINISYLALGTLISTQKQQEWNELIKYFPEYESYYTEIYNKYNTYLDNLLDYYIRCKIKPDREFIDLPKQYKKTLVEVHNRYKQEKSKGNHLYKINRNEIDSILRSLDLPLLYSVITA